MSIEDSLWYQWPYKWVPPDNERVPINIHPEARDRLRHVLHNNPRFSGIGYSQFIMMALDMLTEYENLRERISRGSDESA